VVLEMMVLKLVMERSLREVQICLSEYSMR